MRGVARSTKSRATDKQMQRDEAQKGKVWHSKGQRWSLTPSALAKETVDGPARSGSQTSDTAGVTQTKQLSDVFRLPVPEEAPELPGLLERQRMLAEGAAQAEPMGSMRNLLSKPTLQRSGGSNAPSDAGSSSKRLWHDKGSRWSITDPEASYDVLSRSGSFCSTSSARSVNAARHQVAYQMPSAEAAPELQGLLERQRILAAGGTSSEAVGSMRNLLLGKQRLQPSGGSNVSSSTGSLSGKKWHDRGPRWSLTGPDEAGYGGISRSDSSMSTNSVRSVSSGSSRTHIGAFMLGRSASAKSPELAMVLERQRRITDGEHVGKSLPALAETLKKHSSTFSSMSDDTLTPQLERAMSVSSRASSQSSSKRWHCNGPRWSMTTPSRALTSPDVAEEGHAARQLSMDDAVTARSEDSITAEPPGEHVSTTERSASAADDEHREPLSTIDASVSPAVREPQPPVAVGLFQSFGSSVGSFFEGALQNVLLSDEKRIHAHDSDAPGQHLGQHHHSPTQSAASAEDTIRRRSSSEVAVVPSVGSNVFSGQNPSHHAHLQLSSLAMAISSSSSADVERSSTYSLTMANGQTSLSAKSAASKAPTASTTPDALLTTPASSPCDSRPAATEVQDAASALLVPAANSSVRSTAVEMPYSDAEISTEENGGAPNESVSGQGTIASSEDEAIFVERSHSEAEMSTDNNYGAINESVSGLGKMASSEDEGIFSGMDTDGGSILSDNILSDDLDDLMSSQQADAAEGPSGEDFAESRTRARVSTARSMSATEIAVLRTPEKDLRSIERSLKAAELSRSPEKEATPESDQGSLERSLSIQAQRSWLNLQLEQSIVDGLETPLLYGRRGSADLGNAGLKAAVCMQAWARGRLTRLRHGEDVQTRLVIADAQSQVKQSSAKLVAAADERRARRERGELDEEDHPNPAHWDDLTLSRTRSHRAAIVHRLKRVDSTSGGRWFTDEEGNTLTPQHMRLARAQHWRTCPKCGSIAQCPADDGSCRCPSCVHLFRWTTAPLYTPVASLAQLRQEMRWEHTETRRKLGDAPPSWSDVARSYWGRTSWPPRTRGAAVKFVLYRTALAAPLLVAMPILVIRGRQRHRRECAAYQRLAAHYSSAHTAPQRGNAVLTNGPQ